MSVQAASAGKLDAVRKGFPTQVNEAGWKQTVEYGFRVVLSCKA